MQMHLENSLNIMQSQINGQTGMMPQNMNWNQQQ